MSRGRRYLGQPVRGYTDHSNHVRKCGECGVEFDSRIFLPTGEHMSAGRPASYCSDRCQNTAQKRRQRARRKTSA